MVLKLSPAYSAYYRRPLFSACRIEESSLYFFSVITVILWILEYMYVLFHY